jgi:hypothetical protein
VASVGPSRLDLTISPTSYAARFARDTARPMLSARGHGFGLDWRSLTIRYVLLVLLPPL